MLSSGRRECLPLLETYRTAPGTTCVVPGSLPGTYSTAPGTTCIVPRTLPGIMQHSTRHTPCCTWDIDCDHIAQHRVQSVLYPGYCWRPTAQPQVQHCAQHIAQHQTYSTAPGTVCVVPATLPGIYSIAPGTVCVVPGILPGIYSTARGIACVVQGTLPGFYSTARGITCIVPGTSLETFSKPPATTCVVPRSTKHSTLQKQYKPKNTPTNKQKTGSKADVY